MSVLTKYEPSQSARSYGARREGLPVDESKCQAMVTVDQGRAPANYRQCDLKPKTERPASLGIGLGKEEVTIPVCGRHASVYDKAVEKAKAEREERVANEVNKRSAQKVCDTLKGLGLEAFPYYRHGYGSDMGGYTGAVVIQDPQKLLTALRTEIEWNL